MKKKIIFIGLFLLSFKGFGQLQYMEYRYDHVGNRTVRQLMSPRLSRTDLEESATNESIGLKVFPNPARNSVTIQIEDLGVEGYVLITLCNNEGKILLNKKQYVNSETVSITNCSTGNYYLIITVDKKQTVKKILKL